MTGGSHTDATPLPVGSLEAEILQSVIGEFPLQILQSLQVVVQKVLEPQ